MGETVIAAIIAASASVICQLLIHSRSRSLIAYRLDRLEEKVSKMNELVERLCIAEQKIKLNSHRISSLAERCN